MIFFQVINLQIIYFSKYNVKQKPIYFSNCYTFVYYLFKSWFIFKIIIIIFINKYKDKQASHECALRMQIEFFFIAYLLLY